MLNEYINNIKIIGKFKYKKGLELKLKKADYYYNSKVKHSKDSSYLLEYKKYFHKKLIIKYNILPEEYKLMQIENFIKAKYCHSLANFKEDLLFNYQYEFLKEYYKANESLRILPLFWEFYKIYLIFFCWPVLAELKLNDFIKEMIERKAKCFYQENYQDENEEKKESNIINTIFFTNKIRKDISRKNSLTDLSKTTIDLKSTNSKNSYSSYISINLLINEIGNGNNNNHISKITKSKINNLEEQKNVNKNIKNNNDNANKKLNKINKIRKKDFYYYIIKKANLIHKKSNLKNSPTITSILSQEGNSINHKNIFEMKINSKNSNNNISKGKNTLINNKSEINNNKSKEKNNINSKPLYNKINIVNNKIIIITNNRSKENALKLTKTKIIRNRNKNTLASSRNFKSNLFSSYRQSTIRTTENKSLNYTNNNSNINDNTFFLKTFRDKIHKKGFSKNNYHNSIQTKSDSKMKHIKLLKDKKLNSKIKKKNLVQTYISKKHYPTNTNLLANYIRNYKYYKNNSMLNEIEFKKKNLTNFQRFSNNIKNVNLTQGIRNISKERNMPFNSLMHSTCSLGTRTNHKNKTKNIIKISTYKILENIPKLKYGKKSLYKKRCSKQERELNSKLDIITFNKNIQMLKLNKK